MELFIPSYLLICGIVTVSAVSKEENRNFPEETLVPSILLLIVTSDFPRAVCIVHVSKSRRSLSARSFVSGFARPVVRLADYE